MTEVSTKSNLRILEQGLSLRDGCDYMYNGFITDGGVTKLHFIDPVSGAGVTVNPTDMDDTVASIMDSVLGLS